MQRSTFVSIITDIHKNNYENIRSSSLYIEIPIGYLDIYNKVDFISTRISELVRWSII